MISRRSTMLAALSLSMGPALAMAQSPEAPKPSDRMISRDDARRIAADNGMARIDEMTFDDGHWKIEGRDSIGGIVQINLRGSDGTVLRVERERPASAKADRR